MIDTKLTPVDPQTEIWIAKITELMMERNKRIDRYQKCSEQLEEIRMRYREESADRKDLMEIQLRESNSLNLQIRDLFDKYHSHVRELQQQKGGK